MNVSDRKHPRPALVSIEITIDCRACGDEYTPSHADYVRGDWRLCPACRAVNRQTRPPAPLLPYQGDDAA